MKPCPLCGSQDIYYEKNHGIECRRCGLWLGAGTKAWKRYRDLHGDKCLEGEPRWLEDVWNNRSLQEVSNVD